MLTRRHILSATGAGIVLGSRALPAVGSEQGNIVQSKGDILSRVTPEFREGAKQVLAASDQFSWGSDTLSKIREIAKTFIPPRLAAPVATEAWVPGSNGAPSVRVLVINANAGEHKPAVLHIHGGGYVTGSADGSVRDAQQLALDLDCVVVTVDYRLAPETPFPGARDDCYAALHWLYNNAAELGVDWTRIAIKGESAGGGHAASVALVARDRGEVSLVCQILIYPMLDDRTGTTRIPPAHIGEILWTADQNKFGWSSLLGHASPGTDIVPLNAVPARIDNVAGLPPTFIGVGAIDLFVEEDLTYGQKLIRAGVPTEVVVVPGAFHGFDVLVPDAPLAKSFRAAWSETLRRAFTLP